MAEIFAVIGTRAELIKLWPLLLELEKLADFRVIGTGQHALDAYAELLGAPSPDIYLTEPPSSSSKFHGNTFKALFFAVAVGMKLRRAIPEAARVILHGDTMSTASAALFLSRRNILYHVEAGLRSHSIFEPFPEEIARRIVDSRADFLFPVGRLAEINLVFEGVRGKIIPSGNTVIDSLSLAMKKTKAKKGDGGYAILTVHRHENLKSRERMKKILEITRMVAEDLDVFFFVHDNTLTALRKFDLLDAFSKVTLMQRIANYLEFVPYLAKATVVLTDGGSIQEESAILRKPCLLLRKRTERVELLYVGASFLTALKPERALRYYSRLKENNFKLPRFKFPYGSRGISRRIARAIVSSGE